MARRKKKPGDPSALPLLPKNALTRISLGDSFAEYDMLQDNPEIFVSTNAYLAASDPARNKCFFIGRRGTGKTAITIQLHRHSSKTVQIFPEVFAPLNSAFDPDDFELTHQKPMKSVVSAFELTLGFELLYVLLNTGKIDRDDLPDFVRRELKIADNEDFDIRTVRFVERILTHLKNENNGAWLKDIKRPKLLANALNKHVNAPKHSYSLLIDRLDDSWDGSPINIRFLTALMHACGEFTTRAQCARALLFLRENVFERVREVDTEFSRIETRVAGLNWTREKLVEFVERRLNAPFTSRWPLGGPTWATFFEGSDETQALVFDFCQQRPRDVLTYVKFAVEAAASRNHNVIQVEDLLSARKRFSDSRLKDLADEYDENYPRIHVILDKFYGFGWRLTRRGLEAILQNLISDSDVSRHCASWFFKNSTPESFVNILFQIGFLGIVDEKGNTHFRSIGADTTRTPAISSATDFEIHPMYRDALDLQNIIMNTSADDLEFGTRGIQTDLPEGLDLHAYEEQLEDVSETLKACELGHKDSTIFEDVVGKTIQLCFFRTLANVQQKSRSYNGHQIRDWVTANRAHGGFWEMVRVKWGATQVIWECKNYSELKADDFHQIAYYANEAFGRFAIVVFRGSLEPRYFAHLNTILKDKKVFVLLLTENDLQVFIRQAKAGKVKESHIQDKYDHILRHIA